MNPILAAIYCQSEGALVNLLNSKRNLNLHDVDEAFLTVVKDDKWEIQERFRWVEILLYAGASPDVRIYDSRSALYVTTSRQEICTVELLLEFGCNINYAAEDGRTALHAAALCKNDELCSKLLHVGAKPNAQDEKLYTPLMLLLQGPLEESEDDTSTDASVNDTAAIKTLLICSDLSVQNNCAQTALHIAAQYERPKEEIELLLSHGAPINVQDSDGDTALMIGVRKGNIDVVEILLSRDDCCVNLCNARAGTALHEAVFVKDGYKIAELLLYRGANVNTLNKSKCTALGEAVNINCPSFVKFMIRHNWCEIPPCCLSQLKCLCTNRLLLEAMWRDHWCIVYMMLLACAGNSSPAHWRFMMLAHKDEVDTCLQKTIKCFIDRPHTLLNLSRAAVRRAMGSGIGRKVEKLSLLPAKMCRFLMFSEFDDIH